MSGDSTVDSLRVGFVVGVGDRLRQPEVQQLHAAVRAHDDVAWLEVAVDDSLLVRGAERLRDLSCDLERVREAKRAAREAVVKRLALDQLQHDGRQPVGCL